MPNSRLRLSEKDLGHIRHMGRLASQLPGDWSGMGSDWWDIGEGAQQYELAFMAYTLGIVQQRYTPAYRDYCKGTIEKLIGKMMVPDIWEKWILASRGGKVVDPDQEELGPGWIDPIKKHNIMFKGHLLQMGALHEALYGTGRYAEPGAFTFEFKATTWGNGNETFVYDLPELARIVYQEFVDSNYEGVQCEPNRMFGMCNQHAILGLLHHDQAFGTGYAADVMPRFKEAWVRKGYTNEETGSHMLGRLVRQDQVFHLAEPWADGWTGIFMHAWDRDFIQSVYPRERDTHLKALLAGKEHARACCAMVPTGAKIGFGMFTALAAEVGDSEAREALVDYADRNFRSVWHEGALHFQRSDNWMPDEKGDSEGVDVLTANALLPMARLNSGSGFWDLYNMRRDTATLDQPYITGIDQQVAGVARAYYDDMERALHLSLLPGPKSAETLSFVVSNLDRGEMYVLRRDDTELGRLGDGEANGAIGWDEGGNAVVRTTAGSASDYVLAPVA